MVLELTLGVIFMPKLSVISPFSYTYERKNYMNTDNGYIPTEADWADFEAWCEEQDFFDRLKLEQQNERKSNYVY